MAKITRLPTGRPRKIAETVYSERGLRLSPLRRVTDSGWFLPLIATLPVAAFVLVFFW